MLRKPLPPSSGQLLLADYQTAFVSAATAEAAQYEASRSENELIDHLESISGGMYLNPGNFDDSEQMNVTRASLDAHIKKVQAQQLNSMNAAQLEQLIEQDQQQYKGRRVKIAVQGGAKDVLESVWFDERRGYHTSRVNRRTISGVVEVVLLEKNMLVLKPSFVMRLINSSLQNYIVYIIDPKTLLPMVDLSFY